MSTPIQTNAKIIVMDERDHVATALQFLQSGEQVSYIVQGQEYSVRLKQDIILGHKLALLDMEAGVLVRKYGEVIGRAARTIVVGEHVHVHNLEGIRGRGDQARQ
ncbi:UxaA family hydrolase [Paenibacillus sp. ACRRX]|uniref:UxaA family hydrolase n=1 Tax=unclassified Paenibacillus TaxID=185978 RepID=UPI001EF4F5B9|nr:MULTISPECIES: UxaA family hydrolase [unclassified Paenibacillus]MCG7407239.1 UxaA family hydrolase [Paenibacillus sp. ACRRX]MDK8180458.1 UxaA family hydrolase [Paenibacillus sp. UMB4589-SE434]